MTDKRRLRRDVIRARWYSAEGLRALPPGQRIVIRLANGEHVHLKRTQQQAGSWDYVILAGQTLSAEAVASMAQAAVE